MAQHDCECIKDNKTEGGNQPDNSETESGTPAKAAGSGAVVRSLPDENKKREDSNGKKDRKL